MDNDFGLAYEQGFDTFAEESDHIGEVTFVRHDPAAATLTNEMTTLAASGPDIFIAMTAGNPCLLAVEEAARTGITDIAVTFMPSVCKAVSAYMAPAGEAAADWYIFGGGWKDSTDPQYAKDSYISWMNEPDRSSWPRHCSLAIRNWLRPVRLASRTNVADCC